MELTERNRPRMNLTLDPEVKDNLKKAAAELNLSVSRLLEEIAANFLSRYEDDPLVGYELKRESKIKDDSETTSEKEEQIDRILDQMDF